MASLGLIEADYAWVTQQLMAVAKRHCKGRIISCLEGGYVLSPLARSVAAHVKVLIGADTGLGWATAIIMALNTAIAAYYYLNVAKAMVFDDAPDGDTMPARRTPPALTAAVAITLVATFVFGVLPGLLSNVTAYGPIALGR